MVQTSLQTRPPPPCEEPSPTSGERLSALQRLGPLIPNSETTRTSNAESPVKRKPGRPPGRRVVSASPKKILGTNTTKRRTTNAKPPTSRHRLAAETSQQNRATKLSAVRAGASKTSPGKSGGSTNSDNQPIRNMIPAMARRKPGFRTPVDPLP